MNLLVKIFSGVLIVCYPLAIYFGLNYFEPKYLGLVLLVIIALKLIDKKNKPGINNQKQNTFLVLVGVIIVFFTFISNSLEALKLYPVLINMSMLAFFCYSLIYPPTIIERLARLTEPDLPISGIIYTRLITKIWCVFFIVNGAIAFYTAYFATFEVWALYNGLIAYGLMGLLLSTEWLYRKLILKK